MAELDPIRIIGRPDKWRQDEEISTYLDFLENIISQLSERGGGPGSVNDIIDDLKDQTLGADSRRQAEVRQLTKRVRQLENEVESTKALVRPKKLCIDEDQITPLKAELRRLRAKINEIELAVN